MFYLQVLSFFIVGAKVMFAPNSDVAPIVVGPLTPKTPNKVYLYIYRNVVFAVGGSLHWSVLVFKENTL